MFSFGGFPGATFFMPGGPGAPAPGPAPTPGTAHYATLNVPRTASAADIKRAYMAIAKKEHPDKGGDADRFKAVSAAYAVLGNPALREAYDVGGDAAVAEAEGRGGAGPGRGPAHAAVPPITVSITVAFADVVTGVEVPVTLQRRAFTGASETCRVSVAVPKGAVDGLQVRLPDAGHAVGGPGSARGDVVAVVVVPEAQGAFRRASLDLVTHVQLPLWRAFAGGAVVVSGVPGAPAPVLVDLDVLRPQAPDGHHVFMLPAGGVVQVPDIGFPLLGVPSVRGVLQVHVTFALPTEPLLHAVVDHVGKALGCPDHLGRVDLAAAEAAGAAQQKCQALDAAAAEDRTAQLRHAVAGYMADTAGEGPGGMGPTVQCAQQ
jgi:DnaJ-class molecular chaperone